MKNATLTQPLRELFEGFDEIPDPRARRSDYPLDACLRLAVLALICGQVHLTGIAQFGKGYTRLLHRGLGFPKERLPSRWTLMRLFTRVSLGALTELFERWTAHLLTRLARGELRDWKVSVDGKASRGSPGEGSQPLMMLNVFVHEARVVAASWVVPKKEAETTVLRARLQALLERFPRMALFLGDAHFANRPLAQALIDAERDFLFRVKGNQPDLCEALDVAFAAEPARPADAQDAPEKKVVVA